LGRNEKDTLKIDRLCQLNWEIVIPVHLNLAAASTEKQHIYLKPTQFTLHAKH
jgi:hypothetical protein